MLTEAVIPFSQKILLHRLLFQVTQTLTETVKPICCGCSLITIRSSNWRMERETSAITLKPTRATTGGRTPARNYLPNFAGARRCAVAGDCDSRRSKPQNSKGGCLDRSQLFQNSSRRGTRTACKHGRIYTASSFSHAHLDESAPISKTTAPSISAESDAKQRP
jgi:hypothetical protein